MGQLEQWLTGPLQDAVGVLDVGKPNQQCVGELVEADVADPDRTDLAFVSDGTADQSSAPSLNVSRTPRGARVRAGDLRVER